MSGKSKFITIIRPDFMEFCQDACRAATLNHILFRIAGKCKDQPKEKVQAGEITWHATTEQIREEMSHAWGVCKIRKEVNALIDMGLIGRDRNPDWGVDRTKFFSFGTEQCKKFLQLCQEHHLCIVHIGLPAEVMHLIYVSNANDTSIECICEKYQMQAIHLSLASDRCIEAIYKEDSKKKKESLQESEKKGGAPPPVLSQQEKHGSSSPPKGSTPSHGPVVCSQEALSVMEMWDEVTGRKHTRPDWDILAAEDLARVGITREQMTLIYHHLRKNPPKRGINLESVSKAWGMLDQLEREASSAHPTRSTGPREMDPISKRNAERMFARVQATRAQNEQQEKGTAPHEQRHPITVTTQTP